MAEIINLNKVRKKRAIQEKKAKAEENRHRFGLNKGQKVKDKAERNAERNRLEGLRLYRPDSEEDDQ